MEVTKLSFLFLIFISSETLADTPSPIGDGHCIWYDTCIGNPDPGKEEMYLNCRYNGTAKLLSDSDAISNLQHSCPELMDEMTAENGTIYTCCSAKNIKIMSQQLGMMESILSRCPACLSNLRKNFCFFACHPRMSNFLVPTKLYGEGVNESIYTVNQTQHYDYINSAYASCEKVYYPEMNEPALAILCGPWGVDHCTPERLFDYFGNNVFAPFNVTYMYLSDSITVHNDIDDVDQEMEPFNPVVMPCNTNDTSMHCLCSDCAQSCPPAPVPEPPPDYKYVGDLRLYAFILIMIYVVYFIILIVITFAVAKHPNVTICICLLIIIIFSLGLTQIKMTTDPVELWASPDSQTRKDKDYFDSHFGPFYRTNQIIVTTTNDTGDFNYTVVDPNTGFEYEYAFTSIFEQDFMLQIMDLQLQIMNLTATLGGHPVTLNEICIKPMSPQNDECLIQSIMNYWQNDPNQLKSMMTDEDPYEYLSFFLQCTSNPTYIGAGEECLGTYGGPVLPYVALGGFLEENQTLNDSPQYQRSTAFVITFLVQNYLNDDLLKPALAWEKVFLDFILNYSNPNMDIAIYAERGIEDEIIRESKSDVSTIAISYIIMFAYVTLALGGLNICHPSELCVTTKISMGLSSVVVVFLSFISATGFGGWCGLESTLFVMEVIPFLVLAVGVDNIFLMVQSWQRSKRLENESTEEHVARVVSRIAPSMLVATTAEIVCFFLGALSQMPAVYSFAIYAGIALTFDFLLQITCLVALITLDAKRIEQNRYDIVCCLKREKQTKETSGGDCCFNFFGNILAPFLMKDWVRVLVLIAFPAAFITSCIYTPKLDVGLEQDQGMPDDSFVIKYFDFFNDYLSVGSPVYFVVTEKYDYPDYEAQNLVCSSNGCNDDSVLTQIFVASLSPTVSSIATGASSWIDAYFSYISNNVGLSGAEPYACCRLDKNGEFISSSASWDPSATQTCLQADQFIPGTGNRPLPEYFMENLPYFLMDNPHDTSCPQAGHPAYGTAVDIIETGLDGWNATAVGANSYMAYHTILKTSADFTFGLDMAYRLCDDLTTYLRTNIPESDIRVFPYSIFYVYYEQYLTMWHTVGQSLGISFASLVAVFFLLTGFDLLTTIVNLIAIVMILVDIMAFMVAWNIQLNAISLVNLVMACGISVEFCSHITHAFANVGSGTKKERARTALSYTGSSVFSGITVTKFLGIIILAFANSRIITIYYFRMYLLIVLLGAAHGLLFIPVLLSVIGPPINPYLAKSKKSPRKAEGLQDVMNSRKVDIPRNGYIDKKPTGHPLDNFAYEDDSDDISQKSRHDQNDLDHFTAL